MHIRIQYAWPAGIAKMNMNVSQLAAKKRETNRSCVFSPHALGKLSSIVRSIGHAQKPLMHHAIHPSQ